MNEDICWVKYAYENLPEQKKSYLQRCAKCSGNDSECRAYIPQSYWSKSKDKLKKKPF